MEVSNLNEQAKNYFNINKIPNDFMFPSRK